MTLFAKLPSATVDSVIPLAGGHPSFAVYQRSFFVAIKRRLG